MLEGSLTSYGDLAPFAELLWNHGVNNYMAYVTGNIPVGDYDPTRIPNIGLGHGAIDVGGAYTYFNPATGNEISGVAGFTYNFRNPDTQYRSGIDFHFDWGASHYLTKQLFVGIAGYAYQQITDDSGQNPILGGFRSRVFGVGPQIGYSFPVGDMQGFLGLRAYGEFDGPTTPGLEHVADLRYFPERTCRRDAHQASADEIGIAQTRTETESNLFASPTRLRASAAICRTPLGVNRVILTEHRPLPAPNQRTSSDRPS